MNELKVGAEYKMKFPFKKVEQGALLSGDFFYWEPGCWLFEEDDGSDYGRSRDFYANAEGEVIYKILSIAKMPEKFMDRVIYKRWLINPEGKKYNNGSISMDTANGFYKDINSISPFNANYEIDESVNN